MSTPHPRRTSSPGGSIAQKPTAPISICSARFRPTRRRGIPTVPSIPYSTPGYTGRRVYRTKANNTVYYRLADIRDVTSTYILDNTADAALTGDGPANPSTAGGQPVYLTSIPIGPSGTLARKIYRTIGNGSELKLLTQISDNSTTTFLDAVP